MKTCTTAAPAPICVVANFTKLPTISPDKICEVRAAECTKLREGRFTELPANLGGSFNLF